MTMTMTMTMMMMMMMMKKKKKKFKVLFVHGSVEKTHPRIYVTETNLGIHFPLRHTDGRPWSRSLGDMKQKDPGG